MTGLAERMETKSSSEAMASAAAAVSFAGVSHSFNGTRVLNQIELTVAQGEFCAVVGPSGCGKTTCLNMIVGEVRPSTGSVSALGREATTGSQQIAYMYARDALFPWRTAEQNVALPLEAQRVSRGDRKARVDELLNAVGLRAFGSAYPAQLSHGMRQRVALARTFAVSPQLLLMDEPFAALDAQTRLLLEQYVVRLWETNRSTVILVTHDLSEAIALADRVVLMSRRPGRIKKVFDVPLERPRSIAELQGSPEFHTLYESIWASLRDEVERL